MKINGVDHVEYYTADLAQTSMALCEAFGFRVAGRSGPVPGTAGSHSLLLRQGQIQLLLTATTSPDDQVSRYLRRHGDGVAVIAFGTDDVSQTFADVVAAGATPVASPAFHAAGQGQIGTAVVRGFGDVLHRLVQRDGDGTGFSPGTVVPEPAEPEPAQTPLELLDHIAACLPAGDLDRTVAFYRDVFGLEQIYDERIEVGTQAMLSKVVQDHNARVTFTLIEPDVTREPGQIDEFLRAHGGPGVQHLAFRTDDIAAAVRAISGRGVEFLVAPGGYYQALGARLGPLAIPIEVLRELNVLADTDRWGQMFQIFARSTHERHTFFIELIERKGALTFGSRNIKALYEALDDEHAAISH
jgi:4-hydroxymandelate synthase